VVKFEFDLQLSEEPTDLQIKMLKKYFSEIQKDMTDMENAVEEEISLEKNYPNKIKDKKKDER